MLRHSIFTAAGLAAAALAMGIAAPAQAQNLSANEKLFAELAKLPAEERKARLIAGAKKEGKLEMIHSLRRKLGRDHIKGFTKMYPFIEVKNSDMGSQDAAERLVAEETAGRHLTDVANAQGKEKACQRGCTAVIDSSHQIGGRLFAHALQRGQLLLGQGKKIGHRVDQPRLHQLIDQLVSQSFDIHGTARGEVLDGLLALRGTEQPAAAAKDHIPNHHRRRGVGLQARIPGERSGADSPIAVR